jgi:phage gp29-like protein
MAKSIFDIPLFNDGIISSDKEDKVKKFRGEDNEIPLSVPAYDLASYVYSGNTSTYNITLPRIATILNQAKSGDAREQSQLFKMLQDKDPIISAHLQTRKQAVQSVEWNITGGESDYKRSEVTKILQDAGIDELIKHLSDAVAIGYSGAGIQWKMGGGDIDGFTFINSDNWIFNEYGDVGLTNYQGSDIVISDKSSPWNDIFIFHKYMLRPGIASEGGLLRNLAQYSFFKSEAVGNFARFLEKYGMPLLSTTIPKSDFENSSTRNRIKNILKNFGSDGAAVMAEGSKIENLAGSTAANAPIFTAFIDEMNKNITLAILGQEATSGVAGGLSKGQAQENVRLDLLSGDCKALSETINRQLVSHLEYNKWASKELKFVMNYEPAEDIKTLAEKINAAKSLGFDPPKDWVEEKFKMPLNDAKETFSLGAMPTTTPTAESAPAIPAVSVQ